jgi:spore coat polysaccharide biosynthesis protein SpsF
VRAVAIIQARMGSTRLAGKVLADLGGASLLGRVVQRLRGARMIDDVVVATTGNVADDPLAAEAIKVGAGLFRGNEHDVLTRYLGAARTWQAELVVRVTAACPLLDAAVIDEVVTALASGAPCDYASNTLIRTYPRGLDVEVLHLDALERLGRLARTPETRAHVTSFVMESPALFRVRQIRAQVDDSDLRWTVETAEDLALVCALYDELQLADHPRPYADVVAAVRARPTLTAVNGHLVQKPWQVSHVA